MSEIQRRATEAQTLLSDQSPLPGVLAEIREDAQAAFLVSGGDPAKLAEAYEGIKAVAFLEKVLQRRMNAGSVEAKAERRKEQRGKD